MRARSNLPAFEGAKREWQEGVNSASGWLGTAVFWLVLGSCLLILFLKQVFARAVPAGSK